MDQQRELFFGQVLTDLEDLRRVPVNAKFILPLWKALEGMSREEKYHHLLTELVKRAVNPQYHDRDGQTFQECRAIWHILMNQLGFGTHIRYRQELLTALISAETKFKRSQHA